MGSFFSVDAGTNQVYLPGLEIMTEGEVGTTASSSSNNEGQLSSSTEYLNLMHRHS